MKYLLHIVLFFTTLVLSAQAPVVSSVIDTAAITIGEQVELTLKVEHAENVEVEWPFLVENIGDLEIVKNGKIDTVRTETGFLETQAFKLTAFDSGYYALPGLAFKYKLDNANATREVRTKAHLIRVETIPIDTTKQEIQPIKELMVVPYKWTEAIPYLLGGLGILLGIAALLFLLKRRKVSEAEIKAAKPKRPAHEVAIEKLNFLEGEKRWQQGEIKNYYTQLTEILREYVENRFDVPALELTTDEIVKGMLELEVEDSLKNKFYQLLRMSDLVKFAKASPEEEDHRRSMKSAQAFVQHTKNLAIAEQNIVSTSNETEADV